MASQDDEDLKLIRASASLLDDLVRSLPRLLWKSEAHGSVHQLIRQRDLDYVIQLIEPFQPDPQLLDARLKIYLPTIINAYLSYLQLPSPKIVLPGTVSLDIAVSRILYTLCKVRGEKVMIGFFNNEPRYLNLILSTLEACTALDKAHDVPWEKPYILLVWLRHLLLAPFDLASISGPGHPSSLPSNLRLPPNVPSIADRVLSVGVHFINSATKEQDAASKLLVRLVIRPDMQILRLPSSLVQWALDVLSAPISQSSGIHAYLGPLRFLVGMTVSPDSDETMGLIPSIYSAGQKLMDNTMFAFLTTSAVTKKLIIKMFRNIAILSLQPTSDVIAQFFDDAGVLEDTIDFLLQALGDRDTPVRFAASKALSMLILRLDPALSHEVVQAILDSMKDDMPASLAGKDFSTVDALRWHGLTLSLAHALFRRSASPAQLPDIVNALLLALTFEQRGTTGSSIGSNVRDAACFGIWSFSRRYSTAELLSVNASEISVDDGISHSNHSAIQLVAVHLLLAACLDPAGNIRRGSSAALQELIGRHPDQVSHGIPLVQVVDYHAVGLRQRAAIDVAYGSSSLDPLYRQALVTALSGWRGLGSPDVASREMAATSLGRLCEDQLLHFTKPVIEMISLPLLETQSVHVENTHGSLLALSSIVDARMTITSRHDAPSNTTDEVLSYLSTSWRIFKRERKLYVQYSSRALRAELFAAIARALSSLAELSAHLVGGAKSLSVDVRNNITVILAGMVSRSEESLLEVLPRTVGALTRLYLAHAVAPQLFDVDNYVSKLRSDSSAATFHGGGRAIVLAASFPWLKSVYQRDPVEIIKIVGEIIKNAATTEWRVVGVQALSLMVESWPLEFCWIEEVAEPLHAALNDYTITERGDVGSLVRTAAIACVGNLWKSGATSCNERADLLLVEDMTRLSLEKLDRIRLQAARCLRLRNESGEGTDSLSDVSSTHYFRLCLYPLKESTIPAWKRGAMLEGCASSAGVGAESLLQSARLALVETIYASSPEAQLALMSSLGALLKSSMALGKDSQPLLELLAFLLDTIPFLETVEDYSWRNLLALVQKSHFKSNNIPKILAAVDVYRGLARSRTIRSEVLKKLVSMLRTNPYPKVRIAVAECLFTLNNDKKLKLVDWSQPGNKYSEPVQ